MSLGGLGDRRSLLSIPRTSAGSQSGGSSARQTTSVPTGYGGNGNNGGGSNGANGRQPSNQSLQFQKAAQNEVSSVVGSRTLSGNLGGVAPSVSLAPRQAVTPKTAPPPRIRPMQPPASPSSSTSSFNGRQESPSIRSRTFVTRPTATTTRPAAKPATPVVPASPAPSSPGERYEEEDIPQVLGQQQEDEGDVCPLQKGSPSATSGRTQAERDEERESLDQNMRCLAGALMEMRDSLIKMQAHMTEQTKKWTETEQKLKFEIGEIAKIRDGFAAQASALKAEVDGVRADVGDVNLLEKFETLDTQIFDLKDRTNQFLATLTRDVRVFHQPPIDMFSVDCGKEPNPDSDFLPAGSTVLLMPPVMNINETGSWIRTRLISREDGSQKIYWLPIVAVPQVLPSNEDVLGQEAVNCCADFRYFDTNGDSQQCASGQCGSSSSSSGYTNRHDDEDGIRVQM